MGFYFNTKAFYWIDTSYFRWHSIGLAEFSGSSAPPLVVQIPSSSANHVPPKSFAVAIGGRSSTTDETPLMVPCVKGDALCIHIGHKEYKKGLAKCQNALWGRLTLNKGDKPYTTCDLITKLGQFWKQLVNGNWYRLAGDTVIFILSLLRKLVSLGKGYCEIGIAWQPHEHRSDVGASTSRTNNISFCYTYYGCCCQFF